MRKYIVLSLVAYSFIALIAVSLSAQQGFGRMGGRGAAQGDGRGMYDPALEKIVTGQIVNIRDVSLNDGKTTGVGIDLKTESEMIPVYLGPHIYVDLQNVTMSVGDNVDVKGVNVLAGGQQILLAGEVRKGDGVLKLRDDNGVPLWAAGKGHGAR